MLGTVIKKIPTQHFVCAKFCIQTKRSYYFMHHIRTEYNKNVDEASSKQKSLKSGKLLSLVNSHFLSSNTYIQGFLIKLYFDFGAKFTS